MGTYPPPGSSMSLFLGGLRNSFNVGACIIRINQAKVLAVLGHILVYIYDTYDVTHSRNSNTYLHISYIHHTHTHIGTIKGYCYILIATPLYEASGSRVRVQSAGGGWDADPEPLLGVDINIKR